MKIDYPLVLRALRSGKRPPLVGYFGLFLGIVLCSIAIMLSVGTAELLAKRQGDSIILSKDSNPLGDYLGSRSFSTEELASLEQLPGVSRAVPVLRNQFRVFGRLDLPGRSYGSQLFLEAVPPEYLEPLRNFSWSNGSAEVPLVISDDFLFIYNATFAPAYGLPSVQPEMLGMIPLSLTLDGSKGSVQIPARIRGVTKRMQSVLVPQSFLETMNANLGNADTSASQPAGPNKVMLIIGDRAAPEISRYIEKQGYKTEGDALRSSPLVSLSSIISTSMSVIGVCFLILAISQILVSLELSLFQSASTAGVLRSFGYRAHDLAVVRIAAMLRHIGIIAVLACATVTIGYLALSAAIPGTGATTLVAGLGVVLSACGLSIVLSIWRISRPI